MSQTITPPKAQIAIGTVLIGGVSYPVTTSTEFVRFFENIFSRIGGVSGSSSEDLTLSQFEDAGIEETKAVVYAYRDELSQLPAYEAVSTTEEPSGALEALREELNALRNQVQALQQGLSA